MVGLLFSIFFLLTIFFLVKSIKEYNSNGKEKDFYDYILYTCIAGIISIIFLIWGFTLIDDIVEIYIIDNKIAMYEDENLSIEECINFTVKNYMDFEASTYGKFKEDKDAINLVSLFPELKSDTLVQKQIEVYVANRKKVQELKEKKIDLSKSKWMLYFGK